MTINEAMRTYRLPNPTTPEDLECRWSKVLNFGDRVLLAGYYYNGKNKPCYFGAVYEHLDDDLSCEGTIGLRAASEVEFEDDGHAMAWAMAASMNQIEEALYTLTDDADSLASELFSTLESIRYDPVGAKWDDPEDMKEIRGLLTQALERAKKIQRNVGKG